MNFNDIFTTNMILNSVTKINTGYVLLDALYMLAITLVIFTISGPGFKNKIYRKVESLFNQYDKTKAITFCSGEKTTSKRFKAIMFWIGKQNNPTVKKLLEIVETKYSRKSDEYEESKQNCYRVDQNTYFEIDANIYGKIDYSEKETIDNFGKVKHEEIVNLNIYSSKLDLVKIQKWVEDRYKEYEDHVRTKISSEQLLVEIGWNSKDKELDIYYNPWASNATFTNRFFTGKEDILKKIEFFISNPDWYNKRGLPWTLGFLIWGKPGCGKTGFIKALMNMTGRHGITIKLNDKFDLKKLKEVIYDDEICDDLIIPQNKKIIILEDIDCMGELIKDRDLKEKNRQVTTKSQEFDLSDFDDSSSSVESKGKTKPRQTQLRNQIPKDENENNNLSYLLNILDGLQECPGRIVIMTTNKPEVLDSALIREGRIDYKIEFTNATVSDVTNIVKFYWSETSNPDQLTESIRLIDSTIDKIYSHASIVNMCRSSESVKETVEKIMRKIE